MYVRCIDDLCIRYRYFIYDLKNACICKFQVLCNALWYITNQHDVINNAALRKKNVLPVPVPFETYTGYNDIKRKKMKCMSLSSTELDSHGQALYSLLLKPMIKSTTAWQSAAEDIKQLADCKLGYRDHLKEQSHVTKKNQELDHPVRTIGKHASLEHRNRTTSAIKKQYTLLDRDVKSADLNVPVMFDESKHLDVAFENNTQRHRFIANLQLSVPVDLIRFCPGGSIISSLCVVKVLEKRVEPVILTDGARLLQQVRPFLMEFHTGAQRRAFKIQLENVTRLTFGS